MPEQWLYYTHRRRRQNEKLLYPVMPEMSEMKLTEFTPVMKFKGGTNKRDKKRKAKRVRIIPA